MLAHASVVSSFYCFCIVSCVNMAQFIYPFFSFCFVFLGLHLRHMEVPRPGSNQSCSQPMPQPQQCQIRAANVTYTTAHGNARFSNPPSEAKDQTFVLMDAGWIRLRCATMGTPYPFYSWWTLGLFRISVWEKLFWMLEDWNFYQHMFPILLGKYLRVELQDHLISRWLTE